MPKEDACQRTPVGLRPPTDEEVERDRLRVLKEQEWARAMAEGDVARAKARERAEEQRVRALAVARQAAADAKGTVLYPTGAARRAMVRSLLYALGGALAGIGLIVAGGLIYRSDSSSIGSVAVAAVLFGLGVGTWIAGFLAAWYSWWVGLVGFVADKIGDAVAKRLEPRQPAP